MRAVDAGGELQRAVGPNVERARAVCAGERRGEVKQAAVGVDRGRDKPSRDARRSRALREAVGSGDVKFREGSDRQAAGVGGGAAHRQLSQAVAVASDVFIVPDEYFEISPDALMNVHETTGETAATQVAQRCTGSVLIR